MLQYSINEEMLHRIPKLDGVDLEVHGPKFYWGAHTPSEYVVESGYFNRACWIDKKGAYADSSLRDLSLLKALETFVPPRDIIQQVLSLPFNLCSKYYQPPKQVKWPGVVLLGQAPQDHSTGYLKAFTYDLQGGCDKYIAWFTERCQEYTSDLFIKMHPFVLDSYPLAHLFYEIADRNGCTYGTCHMSVIDECSKVIFYNSTAIVDCWMRGVPYQQYEAGTFDSIPPELGRQMVHFLMWKYCLPVEHERETWESIFSLYHNSTELWPLPSKLSWGQWAVDNLLTKET